MSKREKRKFFNLWALTFVIMGFRMPITEMRLISTVKCSLRAVSIRLAAPFNPFDFARDRSAQHKFTI